MDSPSHVFVAETGQPAQRRRKVRLACTLCRARKTGCDGRKPVCTACSLRGWDNKCGYQDSVIQSSAALTLVDLDRRLQRLENESFGDSETPRKATSSRAALGYSDQTGFQVAQGDEIPSSSRSPVSDGLVEANEDVTSLVTSSTMFMRRGLEAAGPGQQYDPGASSMFAEETLAPNTYPVMIGGSSHSLDESIGNLGLGDISFPQDQIAHDLLGWYWRNVHSIFPFLHRPTFETHYHTFSQTRLSSPCDGQLPFDEVVFHATLNMILALACQRNEAISPPEERHYQAEEFYKRSQRLISVETLDSSSVPIVQLLCLRAWYLYYSGRADRCWIMAGVAIRVATGMGLQLVPRRPMNQLEREMRRRVWYCGCVALDRILSSTFGRAPMTSRSTSQLPLPLPIDDEYLSTTEEGSQPEGLPSRLDLAIYSQKMVSIMDAMHSQDRTHRLKFSHGAVEHSVPDPSAILRLNSMIDDFLDTLPEHLRPNADYSRMMVCQEDISYFMTQSQVLKSRLLFIRLLLLRPSLLAEARRWASLEPGTSHTASSMLQERLHLEICRLCLDTVHEVLEKTHGALGTQFQLPAWYGLHFSFASATILLVASLSPNLGVNMDLDPTKSSWERAMSILEFHKTHLPSAAKVIEVLNRYRHMITLRLNARMGSPQSATSSTGGPPHANISRYPNQQGQGQHWDASPGVPGTSGTMMQGLDELLGSESLDEAWLGMQDYGEGDWMLQL
ncbi:activator of stress genes 1 [Podospora fimiseda]|uniref:Activator of stress genes 1 n=1 Tax=Podospora fimiseda TaxID=252190 RepID=A0AAN7BLU0_9PEZI|nr:activator of stress genes 1 [Podospora fimiseda]